MSSPSKVPSIAVYKFEVGPLDKVERTATNCENTSARPVNGCKFFDPHRSTRLQEPTKRQSHRRICLCTAVAKREVSRDYDVSILWGGIQHFENGVVDGHVVINLEHPF